MTKSLVLAALLLQTAPAHAAPRTVRWVLAHTRGEKAYTALLDGFASRLEKDSGGALRVEFVDNKSDEHTQNAAARKGVLDGSADLAQFEEGISNEIPGVVAPFAFRSYAHAEAVFNGPVGRKMLEGLSAASGGKMQGLAFAYSGGYRVLFGAKPVRTLASLKGARMVAPGAEGWSPLTEELLAGLGVRFQRGPDEGPADLVEDVINRGVVSLDLHPEDAKRMRYVTRTDHAMLVTTIVANEAFLSSLDPKLRALLSSEVTALAADERKLSIDLERKNVAVLQARGISVVDLPAAERRKLGAAADAVLKRHPEVWKAVREIRAVSGDERVTSR